MPALVGVVINRAEPWFARRGRVIAPTMGADPAADACSAAEIPQRPNGWTFLSDLLALVRRVIPYFAVGMLLAALVAALLPADAIQHALGGS